MKAYNDLKTGTQWVDQMYGFVGKTDRKSNFDEFVEMELFGIAFFKMQFPDKYSLNIMSTDHLIRKLSLQSCP